MDTVESGKEKQSAYRKEYARLKKALKNEFYLEAIAICYAIIEDRLLSFFHHAGIVSRNSVKLQVNHAVYPHLRQLLNKNDDQAIYIGKISVKESLVCHLLTMSENTAMEIDRYIADLPQKKRKGRASPGYMVDLYRQIHKTIEMDLIVDIFYDLKPWIEDRNQLIHALLNKTTASSELAKKRCAENGYALARALDNCLVKPFKSGNTLRKKYRIQ